MITSLLIANRGEIACRIIRTAQILPELVSGRWQPEGLTEGHWVARTTEGDCPSTTAFGGGPPPRGKLGEDRSHA
jgi:hypothetical protein